MHTQFFATHYNLSQISCLIAHHFTEWRGCFLHNNAHAVIGICPKIAWTVFFDNQLVVKKHRRGQAPSTCACTYEDWQNDLIAYSEHEFNQHAPSDNNPSKQSQYQHGLMGFIGYDLSAQALSSDIAIAHNQPCAYLGHYDIHLKPHKNGIMLVAYCDCDEFESVKTALGHLLKQPLPTPTPIDFAPTWSKADYQNAFEKTQAYLQAGDTYQINLTQQWQAPKTHLAHHLPSLHKAMNAPFAGFLQLDDFELLSVSPELFFEFYQSCGALHVITSPIKGTRPRHTNPDMDIALKHELANSQKDVSENLMIVDLLRNDLGKYAKIGSVKTPQRFYIESFEHVHHMVSTVTAQLNDTHPIGVLFGSLPAGSITGTPKKRACQLIYELETAPRGAYCGTMGYMNFDGTGVWNVLIRTLQKTTHSTQIWAGGGITIQSDCQSEYQECHDKVGKIMTLLA